MRNQPVAVSGFFSFLSPFRWGTALPQPFACLLLSRRYAKARRVSPTPCFEVRAGAFVPTLLAARIEVRRCRAGCLPLFAIASETAGFSLANRVFFFFFFFSVATDARASPSEQIAQVAASSADDVRSEIKKTKEEMHSVLVFAYPRREYVSRIAVTLIHWDRLCVCGPL